MKKDEKPIPLYVRVSKASLLLHTHKLLTFLLVHTEHAHSSKLNFNYMDLEQASFERDLCRPAFPVPYEMWYPCVALLKLKKKKNLQGWFSN